MKRFLLFLVFVLCPAVSFAQIPTINSYVTDTASILSPEIKSNLEQALRSLERETNGVQFVLFIENSYPKEYSLEEYTLKIAEENKVGKKGNDNGILLYVAIDDKAYRWEVGYGVESTLNSALIGRISREYIVANFQEGNYEKGVVEAVNVAGRILLGSQDADILALQQEEKKPTMKTIGIIALIILGIIVLIYISAKKRNGRGIVGNDNTYRDAASGIFWGGFGRGGSGFGGSGGFGGFGGGGGSFGGGGFSGGWR